jgi:RNA polymerase sigma factor (sigma-70 family)
MVDWTELYTSLRTQEIDVRDYDALAREVRRWARADLAGRGPQLIDEVVADTCALVIVSIAAAYGPDSFAGFVKSCYLTTRKRALRELARQLVPLPDDLVDNSAHDERFQELFDAVLECWPTLLTRERAVLHLQYFEGASGRQIAEQLNLTEVNVRRIGHNGRARLRKCAVARLRQAHGYA